MALPFRRAWMAEWSNAPDCKSGGFMPTGVRVPLHAVILSSSWPVAGLAQW